MIIKVKLIILIIFFSVPSFAFNIFKSDKISGYYIDNSQSLMEVSKEDALYCIDSGIYIATQINNPKEIGNLYFNKARIYDYYYEYDSSFIFYKIAAPYLLESSNLIDASKCYINIGYEHYFRGEFSQAIFAYDIAEGLLQNTDEILLISKIYNNKALAKKSIGKYYEAILDFQLVIDLLENTEYEINLANAYNNIGIIYWDQKNYKLALDYFIKCLDLYTLNQSLPDVASTYINIGLIYSHQSDTTNAFSYYDKAIALLTKIENQKEKGHAMIDKAVLLDKFQRFDEAEILFLESLEIFISEKYSVGIFINKCNLSHFYSDRGMNNVALDYAMQAISMDSIDKPLNYLSEAYLVLSSIFTELNDLENANKFLYSYIEIKDSVFNLEINKQLADLQTKYETDKKDLQLILLKKQININELEIDKSRRNTLIAGLFVIMVLISSLIFAVLYMQKRKSYLALVEKNLIITKSDIEKEKKLIDSGINVSDTFEKYQETNLTEKQKKDLLENLTDIMEVEKFFINPQLTINDLSKTLGTNRNYLSQIINENFKTNFNNFLNGFRIKEARKLLISQEYDNYTIEGVGQTVGFYTRATFNAAFKKHTGVTPSFFRNKYMKI